MKRKLKQAFWTRHVRAFEASGQTRQGYCDRRGLAVGSLDYWRRRLLLSSRVAAEVSAFVPLQMHSTSPSGEALLLECVGGARLRLPRDCDPLWLVQVLSGLR